MGGINRRRGLDMRTHIINNSYNWEEDGGPAPQTRFSIQGYSVP